MTMTTATTYSKPKKPVQIDLAPELIAELDRLAADEGLTRATWVRRLLHTTVKGAKTAEAR
jgi:predicted DNA binding CopG/RHH family protein